MPDLRDIDLTLVACRRPELLEATLASFAARVFGHFNVRSVFANLDPAFGDASDAARCVAAIRAHYPQAVITQPAAPGFGIAVKHVWSQTGDRPVFHLEDDWEALHDITPEHVADLADPAVGMVAPAQRARVAGEADFAMRERKVRFFGFTLRRVRVNQYGTSPRFFAPGFARECAALLDPRLDPEKQVYTRANPRLGRFQERFRCRVLWAQDGGPFIRDTGREWRDARRIRKVNRGATVRWVADE